MIRSGFLAFRNIPYQPDNCSSTVSTVIAVSVACRGAFAHHRLAALQ
jgi:hypothetical protein